MPDLKFTSIFIFYQRSTSQM